jgi:hypothetical protein
MRLPRSVAASAADSSHLSGSSNSLRALKDDKSETRDDPARTAKDRADLATLSHFA